MPRVPSKVCETTKPDGDYVWNGFGTIEGLVVYFETQIDNRLTRLDLKNI